MRNLKCLVDYVRNVRLILIEGGNKMTVKEAIEVLKKWGSLYDGTSELLTWDMNVFNEAIDTVVEYCEKQLPCDCVIGFEGDIPVTHKLCDNCKSKIWE